MVHGRRVMLRAAEPGMREPPLSFRRCAGGVIGTQSGIKFWVANWGTRGEVEPFVAIGRELIRRGHDVRMAVAPEMVGFAESAGPAAVAYGPELRAILDPHRDFWTYLFS